MGVFLSVLWWAIGGPRKVIMIGLDAAGKTTLLYRMKMGETVHTIPTIGFNVETIQMGCLQCNVWDIGGQDKLRNLWSHYTLGADLLIFVIDSHDLDRVPTARRELCRMRQDESLSDAPVLVFANKQDMPGAVSSSDLKQMLFPDQDQEPSVPYKIQPCIATTGFGVDEGLQWAMTQLMA